MNAHNRRYFTTLLPCRCCGREPMRVYCDATDRFAIKCTCGNRTKGFTTIAGASHSWNHMNKKTPPVRVQVPQAAKKNESKAIIDQKGRNVNTQENVVQSMRN
jgi:hypothetical protein